MLVIDSVATGGISPSGINVPIQSASPSPTLVTIPIRFPLDIQLGGLLDPTLFFRDPLRVSLYKSEGSYVAECPQVDQFGYGSNIAEALDDLGKTLSEMYLYLYDAEHAGTLGESLSAQYDVLRGFIGRRAPKGEMTA